MIISGKDCKYTIRYTIDSIVYALKHSGLIKGSEVIVVAGDNGTYGSSIETLKTYSGLEYRVYRDLGRSLSYSRLIGYRVSRGKYIFFLDGDMMVSPKYFIRSLEALRECDLVAPLTKTIYLDKSSKLHSRLETIVSTLYSGSGVVEFSSPARIYRREVLEKLGGYPIHSRYFCEDRLTTVLAVRKGYKYCFRHDIVIYKIEAGGLRSIISKYRRYGYGIVCDLDSIGREALKKYILARRLTYINIFYPIQSILYTVYSLAYTGEGIDILPWKWFLDLNMLIGEIKGLTSRCKR